jgi:hypothetical protein
MYELQALLREYDRARAYTDELWKDLTPEEVTWRPHENSSAIGWHLGHQAHVAHFMIRNLTAAEPSPDPELDALLLERYPQARPAGNILNLWPPPIKALGLLGVDTADLGAPCESQFRRVDGRVRCTVRLPGDVIRDYGGGFIGLLQPRRPHTARQSQQAWAWARPSTMHPGPCGRSATSSSTTPRSCRRWSANHPPRRSSARSARSTKPKSTSSPDARRAPAEPGPGQNPPSRPDRSVWRRPSGTGRGPAACFVTIVS